MRSLASRPRLCISRASGSVVEPWVAFERRSPWKSTGGARIHERPGEPCRAVHGPGHRETGPDAGNPRPSPLACWDCPALPTGSRRARLVREQGWPRLPPTVELGVGPVDPPIETEIQIVNPGSVTLVLDALSTTEPVWSVSLDLAGSPSPASLVGRLLDAVFGVRSPGTLAEKPVGWPHGEGSGRTPGSGL